jgi:hypothetical protein
VLGSGSYISKRETVGIIPNGNNSLHLSSSSHVADMLIIAVAAVAGIGLRAALYEAARNFVRQ